MDLFDKVFGPSFKKSECESLIRQASARINIHRNKKINEIQKMKDDIRKHLAGGSEQNAIIWTENLLNVESFIICYDVMAILIDQFKGRLASIEKFGVQADIEETLATIVYAAPKMEVEELMKVREQIHGLKGKDWIKEVDEGKIPINGNVAANVDFIKRAMGESTLRMV
mmetsp:Transcript_16001/g.24812  ORF Transcript_16001/g.24812 Transcript_16001/m.24812 type:complete len:170 (+) Transcript_16001:1-510(+)